MPGSPATSPRLGAPRFDNTDPGTLWTLLNGVVDAVDLKAARWDAGAIGSRPSAAIAGRLYFATDTLRLYLDTGTTWLEIPFQQRESLIIDAEHTTASITYVLLSTADQISGLIVPAGGAVELEYFARWNTDRASGAPGAYAAIFIGSNQLKTIGQDAVTGSNGPQGTAARNQEALLPGTAAGTVDDYAALQTAPLGLRSGVAFAETLPALPTTGFAQGGYGGVVGGTTYPDRGGRCIIEGLPAGTYDVSIRFKALISGDTVKVRDRKLRATVLK